MNGPVNGQEAYSNVKYRNEKMPYNPFTANIGS